MEPESKTKFPPHEGGLVAPNYTKLSENLRRITPQKLQCSIFCGGSHCKYENPEHWNADSLAIQGIFSNWITEDILAMARPSTSIIVQKNVIQQFHSLGIKSIINLQCSREHSSCGHPLEESGFTYEPSAFMQNEIYYYNFAWEDYGDVGLSALVNMVKVLAFAITEGRVAVHCHAGLGRTGVLIASYLVYSLRVNANEAIKYVRLKRPGSVQTRGQIICVRHFAQFILPLTVTFYIKNSSVKVKYMNQFTLQKYLKRQRIILHGYEERKYKYFPMVINVICERILQLCGRKSEEFDVIYSDLTANFLSSQMNESIKRHESVFSITSTLSDSALSSSVASKPAYNSNCDYQSEMHSPEPEEGVDSPKHSVSLSDFSSLDDSLSTEAFSIDKIFEENRKQKQQVSEETDRVVDIEEIIDSLLIDFTSLGEEFQNYVVKFKKHVNSFQYGYYKINHETNPAVLTCLLFDWLEDLRSPVLDQDELEKVVINYKKPEKCIKLFSMENAFVVEYLLRFLKKLLPMDEETRRDLLKRMAAALSHQTISIRDVPMPTERNFRKMRDGTLNCILEFLESLVTILPS